MKNLKFLIIALSAGPILIGCSKAVDPSVTSTVSLTMTASTSSGKPTINGRIAMAITLTDVIVNVREIKFDFDQKREHHNNDSSSLNGNNNQGEHHDNDSSSVDNSDNHGEHHPNDSSSVDDNDDHGEHHPNDSSSMGNNDDQGEDSQHDSSFVDNNNPKLTGPFIVDLMNAGSFVDQVITTIDIPNATYEKVSFKLSPSAETGDMNGKSILITGKIGDTPFEFWHDRLARFGARFQDSTTLVTNGAAVNLAIHLELDKILSAVNGGVDLSTATDGNHDGTITIDPLNDDGNKHLADAIMNLLVRNTYTKREHHD